MDQIGRVTGHVILTPEYQKFYLSMLPTPYSVNGVTLTSVCMHCDENENVKFDPVANVTVCTSCSAFCDRLVPLKQPTDFIIKDWIPILRDSQHNRIYQHYKTKLLAASSTNAEGEESYITYGPDVKLIPTIQLLNKLSKTYSSNWSQETFYNLPIRTFMFGSIIKEPLQSNIPRSDDGGDGGDGGDDSKENTLTPKNKTKSEKI